MGDAPDPRLVALIEATTGALAQRLKNCETTDETLAVALAQRLDTLTGRVSELEKANLTPRPVLYEIDTLTRRIAHLETAQEALTASVGVLRADLVSLQAQRDPWPVMLARLETLSDERNAARRDLMRVTAERDAFRAESERADRCFFSEWRRAEVLHARLLQTEAERNNAVRNCQTADAETGQMRAERNQLQQEAALYRALLTRVRSGDLVRCLTCEGQGHCADCEDERGAPRYGVPGLVPPEANTPLVADVDLTPEETKL